MVTRRTVLASSAIVLGIALTGCNTLIGATYRYRLTVEVDTPKGPRTGSTVVEVKQWEAPAFPSPEAGGLRSSFRGEAVAVDLPGGQTLFILLNNAATLAEYAYRPFVIGIKDPLERARVIKNTKAAVEVPIVGLTREQANGQYRLSEASRYPIFVRFNDTRDPMTIERVDPANLAGAFGKGISLKRMIIQQTESSLPTDIVKRLPWLKTMRPGPLSEEHGRSLPLRLIDIVDKASFSTEIRR